MKKFVLSILVASFAIVVANAQDYKPAAGNVTADFGLFNTGIFTPNEVPVNLLDGMLKGRYFLDDYLAVRGALGFGNGSTKDTSTPNIVDKVSQSTFALGVGIEKHFGGTERLSPYVGADLGFSTRSQKRSHTDKQNSSNNVIVKEAPHTGISVDVLCGADYYIAQHLYLGIEAGIRLNQLFIGKSSTTIGSSTNTSEPMGSASEFGTGLFAGFKLGFAF